MADLILPSLTFFEKHASSLNNLGMIQKTSPVLLKKNNAVSETDFFKFWFNLITESWSDLRDHSFKIAVFENKNKYLTTTKSFAPIKTSKFVGGYSPSVSVNNYTFFKPSSTSIFLRNNIFEKASKVLTDALSNFKKPSNFKL